MQIILTWDKEDGVWVAKSPNIKELVAAGYNLEKLGKKLDDLLLELERRQAI